MNPERKAPTEVPADSYADKNRGKNHGDGPRGLFSKPGEAA